MPLTSKRRNLIVYQNKNILRLIKKHSETTEADLFYWPKIW